MTPSTRSGRQINNGHEAGEGCAAADYAGRVWLYGGPMESVYLLM